MAVGMLTNTAFHVESETPNKRQSSFLGHLKFKNDPEYEVQSFSTQNVSFSKWRPFFDRCILDHSHCHLVDLFKKFHMDKDFI